MKLCAAWFHHLVIHSHPWVLQTELGEHLKVNLTYMHNVIVVFKNIYFLHMKLWPTLPMGLKLFKDKNDSICSRPQYHHNSNSAADLSMA